LDEAVPYFCVPHLWDRVYAISTAVCSHYVTFPLEIRTSGDRPVAAGE
jgi:hypothetical protein